MKKLTQEQRRQVEKWFDEKAQIMGQCPVCRSKSFTLLDYMVAPAMFNPDGIVIGGSSYPFIVIACNNCAHVQFHNAVMMGLLDSAPKTTEAPSAEVSDGR